MRLKFLTVVKKNSLIPCLINTKKSGKSSRKILLKNYNVDYDNHIFEEIDGNPDVLENMGSSILDLHLIN